VKRTGKIAITAGLALLILLVIALVAAEFRLEWLRKAPRLTAAAVNKPDACVVIRLQPLLAPPEITQILAAQAKIRPQWLVHLLPQEIAILFAADAASEEIRTTFFINEQRIGPLIAAKSDLEPLRKQFPGVRWSSQQLERSARGMLTLDGKAVLDASATETLRRRWPHQNLSGSLAASLQETHLFEMALDNRSGGVYALLASALAGANLPAGLLPPEQIEMIMGGISTGHARIDPAGKDAFDVVVHFECDPAAPPETPQSIQSLLGMAQIGLQMALKDRYGAVLTGSAAISGNVVEGKYTISKMGGIYKTMLPAPASPPSPKS